MKLSAIFVFIYENFKLQTPRYQKKFIAKMHFQIVTRSSLLCPGSFITIYLFSKRWKIDDCLMGVIACMSRVAASLVYALAPTRTIYFLGPVMDMFSSASTTSLRSIATKLVDADEVGKSTEVFFLFTFHV